MSFRERTAWITLVTVVLFMGAYFGLTLTGAVPRNSMASFHLGLICIIGLAVVQVALNVLAALMNPKAARTPRDERERAIHARSHILGYYVLMIGMAITLVVTHVPVDGEHWFEIIIRTVNVGVAVMVISALSVAIAQIIMYRRGY